MTTAVGSYIIAGHSHVFALGAKSSDGVACLEPTTDGLGSCVTEKWNANRSDAYWDLLVDSCSGKDVFLCFAGNQHITSFIVRPEEPFDIFDPDLPHIDPNAVLVPRRLVKTFFEDTLELLKEIIARLLDAGCRNIRLIAGPPPRSDILRFDSLLRRFKFANAVQGVDASSVQFITPSLLLKLWKLLQEAHADLADCDRMAYIAVPRAAVDAFGFLHPRFYSLSSDDIMHANAAFGQLMLEQALETTKA